MEIGIVGLPNVGKSTLFNAITKAGAECANYPFCTIEPNVGIVPVPDERLDNLAKLYNPEKVTHAVVKFVDISGLVKAMNAYYAKIPYVVLEKEIGYEAMFYSYFLSYMILLPMQMHQLQYYEL